MKGGLLNSRGIALERYKGGYVFSLPRVLSCFLCKHGFIFRNVLTRFVLMYDQHLGKRIASHNVMECLEIDRLLVAIFRKLGDYYSRYSLYDYTIYQVIMHFLSIFIFSTNEHQMRHNPDHLYRCMLIKFR